MASSKKKTGARSQAGAAGRTRRTPPPPAAAKSAAKPAARTAGQAKAAPAARPSGATRKTARKAVDKPAARSARVAARKPAAPQKAKAAAPKTVAAAPKAKAAPPKTAPAPARGRSVKASAAAAVAPPKAKRSPRRGSAAARARSAVDAGPGAVPGLSEEDQIRAAKFLPRELPKRLFEEERFLFPETYGVNRVRLLVRDPEWIFAYWDVSPAAMRELGRSVGERALALSRLTLRVVDPVGGGSTDILLPAGARWWYVRTDAARRTYRAELGVTLPSGEFRSLAESNTVVTPRVGPSAVRARRRVSYPEAGAIPLAAAIEAGEQERATDVAHEPWVAASVDGAAAPAQPGAAPAGEEPRKGGASDAFRPGGASDTFRPGASDGFRR